MKVKVSKKGKQVFTEDFKHAENSIVPAPGKVAVRLKAWPAQSVAGVISPESYVMIRAELYLAEVVSVGEGVKMVKKGNGIMFNSFAGYHIQTEASIVKIIHESDILTYKNVDEMKKGITTDPKTFKPGLNFILVEQIITPLSKTKAGIITGVAGSQNKDENNAHTKTAKIIAVGPTNGDSVGVDMVKVGRSVIVSTYIGQEIPPFDIKTKVKYKIMYINDILGYVD